MVGGHDDGDGDCHHELQTRPRGLLRVPDELLALLAAVEPLLLPESLRPQHVICSAFTLKKK